jgi:hypothetical protein
LLLLQVEAHYALAVGRESSDKLAEALAGKAEVGQATCHDTQCFKRKIQRFKEHGMVTNSSSMTQQGLTRQRRGSQPALLDTSMIHSYAATSWQ